MCLGWRLWILIILPPTLEQRSEELKRKERAKKSGRKRKWERHGPKTCVCFETLPQYYTVWPGRAEDVWHGHGDEREADKEKWMLQWVRWEREGWSVCKRERERDGGENTNDHMLVEWSIFLLLLSVRGRRGDESRVSITLGPKHKNQMEGKEDGAGGWEDHQTSQIKKNRLEHKKPAFMV